MSDTITVSIPSEVRDNTSHTVRVTSRDTRVMEGTQAAADHLTSYKKRQELFGYSVHEFDDVDRDGKRVTLTWFADTQGQMVWLYETSYYTRIDCARCSLRWACTYVVVEQDGQTIGDPEPLCVYHLDLENQRVSTACEAGMNLRLRRSEWLRVGKY